jgi:hypothetical protein
MVPLLLAPVLLPPLTLLGVVFFADFFLVNRFFWPSFCLLHFLPWCAPPQRFLDAKGATVMLSI